MSGLYIKGFQLPEKSDLYYVKVEQEPGKNPVATIWRRDVLGPMSFGAFETISVPDHGRLIDAEELFSIVDKRSSGNIHTDGLARRHHQVEYREFLSLISRAPTIISAERDCK